MRVDANRGRLLDRAIGFALTAAQGVLPHMLARRTPCASWDLGMLLLHLADSLAALHEGMAGGHVARCSDPAAGAVDPVSELRVQAVRVLRASAARGAVTVGDRRLQGDLMWLVREGYVTEFIDGRLFAPPPMVEARKKEVENEEHDPENFPEAPADAPAPTAASPDAPVETETSVASEPAAPAAPEPVAEPATPAEEAGSPEASAPTAAPEAAPAEEAAPAPEATPAAEAPAAPASDEKPAAT